MGKGVDSVHGGDVTQGAANSQGTKLPTCHPLLEANFDPHYRYTPVRARSPSPRTPSHTAPAPASPQTKIHASQRLQRETGSPASRRSKGNKQKVQPTQAKRQLKVQPGLAKTGRQMLSSGHRPTHGPEHRGPFSRVPRQGPGLSTSAVWYGGSHWLGICLVVG